MDEAIRQKLNRVYGKGFYDGMKATQKEQPMMNETRFNTLYKGMNEQTKRVYQAVPISECWNITQIMAELNRVSASQPERRAVSFCLNTLKDSGLIKETSSGTWARIPVRVKIASAAPVEEEIEKPTKEETVMPSNDTKPATTKAAESPLERIGELSSQVITIIQSLHKLAADIDAAAIEVEEQIEKIKRDSIRLKKLQEIFKDLQE